MTTIKNPKVTIHLPVYNGENYLEIQLDSLLNQTFTDFELLITDNCSTDSTNEICQRYAQADDRVRYHIHPKNIGATANFDSGVELAKGEYFKWAAHDDFHHPEFLQACVDVLDNNPDVVLAQTLVQIVDENGETMATYDSNLTGSDSSDPVERFKPLIHIRHTCTEMFGLFRLDEFKKTKLLGSGYHGCDRAMLAEVSLIGKIVQIKRPLFYNREHKNRYVRKFKSSERSSYYVRSPDKTTPVDLMILYRDYKSAIDTHLADPKDRKRARKLLLSWWFVEWNSVRLIIELASRRFPWIYDSAKWVSDRVVKPQHPTIVTNKSP